MDTTEGTAQVVGATNSPNTSMTSRPLPSPFKRSASAPKSESPTFTSAASSILTRSPSLDMEAKTSSKATEPVPHKKNSGVPDFSKHQQFLAATPEQRAEMKKATMQISKPEEKPRSRKKSSNEPCEVLRKKFKKDSPPPTNVEAPSSSAKPAPIVEVEENGKSPLRASVSTDRSSPASVPISVDSGFGTSTDSEPNTSPATIPSGDTSPFANFDDTKQLETDIPRTLEESIEDWVVDAEKTEGGNFEQDSVKVGEPTPTVVEEPKLMVVAEPKSIVVEQPITEVQELVEDKSVDAEPTVVKQPTDGDDVLVEENAAEQQTVRDEQFVEPVTTVQPSTEDEGIEEPLLDVPQQPKRRGRKPKKDKAVTKAAPILNEVTNDADSGKRKRKYTKRRETEKKIQKAVGRKKSVDTDNDEIQATPELSTIQQGFSNYSVMWFIDRTVSYAFDKEKKNLDEDEIIRVENFLSRNATDPKYWRVEITLDTKFPDAGNYRFCNNYFRENTIGMSDKPFSRKNGQQSNDPVMPLCSTLTAPLHIPLDSTADQVLEHASDWASKRQSAVYSVRDKLGRPPISPELIRMEREALTAGTTLPNFKGADLNRLPVPVLKVTRREEIFDARFERLLNAASITLVSGIGKAAGINERQFRISELNRVHPKMEMDLLIQCPQSADDNFKFTGEKDWAVSAFNIRGKLNEYTDYTKQLKSEAKRHMWKIADARNAEKTAQQIAERLIARQKDLGEQKNHDHDKRNYWTFFGTNIDIYDQSFAGQMKELEKLPSFLLPHNDENLLNLLEENVLGVNTVQMYVKPPGARTPAHMENSLMASINWNVGPGSCVWFAVPYEYWGRLEELTQKNKVNYHGQNYWPDENELLAAGIPVIKFEQRADEMVYVNTGCFHWVQSNGFCTNVSWNVGRPSYTQLATSAISFSHNLETKHRAVIAIEETFWRIAQRKMFRKNKDCYDLTKAVLMRSLARVKSYFDVLEQNGIEIERASDAFRNQSWRCHACEGESFNILLVASKTLDDRDSIGYCAKCKSKSNKGPEARPLSKYMYLETIDVLKSIFDEYKYIGPDALPIASADDQLPSTSG